MFWVTGLCYSWKHKGSLIWTDCMNTGIHLKNNILYLISHLSSILKSMSAQILKWFKSYTIFPVLVTHKYLIATTSISFSILVVRAIIAVMNQLAVMAIITVITALAAMVIIVWMDLIPEMTYISLLAVVVVLTTIGSNASTSCNGPNCL